MELNFPVKPFRTHGGADVPHRKNTAQIETSVMPAPAQVTLPLQQHVGAPCVPTVKVGDMVLVGQKIADSDAYVSAPSMRAYPERSLLSTKKLCCPAATIAMRL